MRRLTFIMLLLSLCLILSSATLAQSPPDDEDTCQDAAGAPVPCPTDEPRPTEAPQPEQPQPQPEQPEPPSGTESEQQQPEQPEPEQPDSTAVNPLRPSATGECQLATFGLVRVNVRQSPAFDAPVIGVLVPDTLYAVDSIFVSGGETWLGVAGGWVHGSTVVYNGDCPVRQVEVIRANYRVMLEPLPESSDEGSTQSL